MHHHTPPDPLMSTESFPTDPSGLPGVGRLERLAKLSG